MFLGLIFQTGLFYKFAAFVVFVIAAITDFLDGYIARKYNLISNFGKIMDPISDKFLMLSCFYVFVNVGLVAPWMFVVIAAREIGVTVHRLMIIKTGQVVAADWTGKIKTVLQMVTAILILLFMIAQASVINTWPKNIVLACYLLIDVLMWSIVLITSYSGWLYFRDNVIRKSSRAKRNNRCLKVRFIILSIMLVLVAGFVFMNYKRISIQSSSCNVEQRVTSSDEWNSFISKHCSRNKGQDVSAPIDEDEYQIYSILIEKYQANELIKSMGLTINKNARGICIGSQNILKDNFLMRDEVIPKFRIDEEFVQARHLKVFNEITTLNEEMEHHNRPGIMSLFRVAFNENRTEAYVSFQYTCGSVCGFQPALIFKNVNGQWIFSHKYGYDIKF